MTAESHTPQIYTPKLISENALHQYQREYFGALHVEPIDLNLPHRKSKYPQLAKPARLHGFYLNEPVFCRNLEEYWLSIYEDGDFTSRVDVCNGFLLQAEDVESHIIKTNTLVPLNRKSRRGGEKTGFAVGYSYDLPVLYATSPWIVGITHSNELVFDRRGLFDFEAEGVVPAAILGRKIHFPWRVTSYMVNSLLEQYGFEMDIKKPGLIRSTVSMLAHKLGRRKKLHEFLQISDF